MNRQKYIASISFGKDSTAMLLMLIERNYPLDEIMFYDTGMEFKAIYNLKERLQPFLKEHNIKYTELKPENPFLYDMLERPVISKEKGKHFGYGWCGGMCRWGTSNKIKTLDAYAKEQNAIVYVGIAYDETKRLERLQNHPFKRTPLADWQTTEAQALQYCYNNGIHWQENGTDLYNILDRVSCWCCCNKNQKELINIRKNLPEYWKNLLELQRKTNRPMKKFRKDPVYGDLGHLLNFDRYLEHKETEGTQLSLF